MTEIPTRRGLPPPLQRNFDALANRLRTGSGTPEAVIAAPVGTLYVDLEGAAATTLYVKETGGNTSAGWAAK